MPFDFKKYDAKCADLDPDALQREWEHYTRLISGAATSTAVSGMAIPFTLGVSSIGVGLAAPAIHNARKKREIIERHLQRHGRTHITRKRDVITAGAISGTVGVVTLGLAPVGADAICNTAAEHSIAYIAENELGVKIATHLALDAVGVAAEETHMHSRREQEAWKAYQQAVKEGKNPPLPNADLKLPVTTSNQTMVYIDYQNESSQVAPSINVIAPVDQKVSDTAPFYFPPPPGQADLKVNNVINRRHSVSTLSLDAQQTPTEPPNAQSNGHVIYGTATAITAPMIAGQSYYIQLPDQSAQLPSRPSSAIGGGTVPTGSGLGYFPPPSPQLIQPENTKSEQDQYQYQTQRPRAYSTASFDRPPSYEMYPQTQLVYGTAQSYLPPPPPPPPPQQQPPPSPFLSPNTPNTHASEYFTTPIPSPNSTSHYQPQYGQNANQCDQSTGYANYNPSEYAQPQQQQHNYHAPPQMVYSPHDMKYPQIDQKFPLVHQYQVSSPSTPMGMQTYYPASGPQQSYSYASGTTEQQQAPYFPPPPAAY